MVLNAEQIEEARRLHDVEDVKYADVAEHFSMPRTDWKQVKDAIDGTGDYAGMAPARSKLAALTAERLAQPQDANLSMEAELRAATNARTLRVDEVREVNQAYEAGLSQQDIGEALEPPVHHLAISDVLSHQGYFNPVTRMPPWSTATKEGERKAKDHARTFTLGPGEVFEPERYLAAT